MQFHHRAPALICLLLTAIPLQAAEQDQFELHVRPLLVAKCQACHGEEKQENGLRLDRRAALLAGGVSGPAIAPGSAAESRLWQMVAGQAEPRMPPDEPLTAEEIESLRVWIDAGAPWPEAPVKTNDSDLLDKARAHWSFQPLNVGALLVASNPAASTSPVDALIAARQARAGVTLAPPADPATLLRRLRHDLTGLPPTAAEVAAWERDASPAAYAQLVDRLLDAPEYGERWGRHWLDVVRYADTAGETADFPAPLAYRYRDYVIRSFQDDKPYDQFLREQIAGDLLAAEAPRVRYAEQVSATGFLAISRRFGFDSENYFHLTIQDTIDTLGQAVLGLSLGCARCHDHKYDPISMRDYYALYGIFDSTRYAFPGSEEKKRPRDQPPLVPAAEAKLLAEARDRELAALDADLERLAAQKQAAEKELEESRARNDLPATARGERRLAELSALHRETTERRQHRAAAPPYELAYGVAEGTPRDAAIQLRGEPLRPGEVVPRRWLEVFGGEPLPAGESGSGRRQLADWLTRRENPLVARVIANRVWQHHFGRGLVATVNDFGRRGQPPSHPELLDYLAARLVASGWSIKALHREIVRSDAYRRSSTAPATDVAADPENRWLSRFSRRPLSAEELRDTLLALGGALERGSPGPHPFPGEEAWNFSQHTPFLADYPSQHRSVYLMVQRIKRHPFLALFDGADPNASTGERSRTSVPTQALFLLNNPLVHEQSQRFAARLQTIPDDDARLTQAFVETLGRAPTDDERHESRAFLVSYAQALAAENAATENAAADAARAPLEAWAGLARTLFGRTEFLFVE